MSRQPGPPSAGFLNAPPNVILYQILIAVNAMPITIPPNRKITIEPKQGGGYQSAGLPDGLPPGALTMGTTTKTATSITGVVTDGNGSTSYQVRVNGGTWQSGLTATGLTAETTYSVEWRGVNASGTGPATTPENVTTSAAGAGLTHGSISNFNVSGLGGRSVSYYVFEGGTNGHLETTAVGQDASFDNWKIQQDNDYGANNPDPFIVNDAQRGHVWNKRVNFPAGVDYDGTFQNNFPAALGANQKLRFSYYVKNGTPTGTGQWKMVRCQKRGDNSYPGIFLFNWNNGNGHAIDYNPGNADSGQVYWVEGSFPDSENAWVKYIFEVDTGTVGVQDGYIHIYYVTSSGLEEIASSSVREWGPWPGPMEVYSDIGRWDAIVWQNYVGNGMSDMQVYMDDPMIQIGSWSSVEIGNNAAYASCTVLEEQEITSWVDNGPNTDVSIRVNTGGLSAGTYTIFFKDDAGSVVHSEAVEIS